MADLSQWTILIIEDNADTREMLVPLLEQSKATVIAAANAEDALGRIKTIHPNLALVDLALPGLDGWEILDTLRRQSRYSDIKLIAMTAFDFPDVAEEALQAGFAAYIPKPINVRTFADDLEKLLKKIS